jgi:mono/diheme cytochrome c family protein
MAALFCRTGAAIAVAAALITGWTGAASAADDNFDPKQLADGKALYYRYCVHCHGINMVSPGTVAADLREFPHDQRDRFFESVTIGKNGRMPPWGDLITQAQIESLWTFVRAGGK